MSEELNTMVTIKSTTRDKVKGLAALEGKGLQEVLEEICQNYISSKTEKALKPEE